MELFSGFSNWWRDRGVGFVEATEAQVSTREVRNIRRLARM